MFRFGFSLLAMLSVMLTPMRAAAQSMPEDLGPFVGTWERHGFFMTVGDDGTTDATWRIYQWCGPGVPEPCDSIINNQRLVSGGHGQIHFDAVDENGAHGQVLWSNEETFMWPGEVSLQLLPAGMAVLRQEDNEVFLCTEGFEGFSEDEMQQRMEGCGA